MKRLIRNRGQSTLEYAVVLAVVIAGLLYIGWGWFRGAYQKRLMSASDEISGGGQFDIRHTSITSRQTRNIVSEETMDGTATGATFTSQTLSDVLNSTVDAQTADLATRRQ